MYVCHAPLISNELTLNFQWVKKGYPSRITDPAPLVELGGPTKIDSIQNTILLQRNLYDAWNNYMFGVNPDVCMFHLSLVLDSAGISSSLSFPGTIILLERCLNSITLSTAICGPLMTFSTTIFFKVC